MSKESDRVVAGFMQLTNSEQQEIIKDINNYLNQGQQQQRLLKESFEKRAKIDLGPLGRGKCPCCGR